MFVLTVNCGSSSVKLQLFEQRKQELQPVFKCLVEAIGLKNALIITTINDRHQKHHLATKTHAQGLSHALKLALQAGAIKDLSQIRIVGHRVVHGGTFYQQATKIDQRVIEKIKQTTEFAPLHNPANLQGINSCLKLLPQAKQIAVFDTAFHQTMPEKAYLYGLPEQITKKYNIRRYGFHGTSHKYVSQQATKYLKQQEASASKMITCHLGNGVSITAVKNGKSVDTSMGFTPLEGVIMGTRSGNIDPSIPLYLQKKLRKTPDQINDILNKQSGLLGMTKISSDWRPIQKSAFKKNENALRVVEVYCYRIAQTIAAYTASLNGLDALVFTAGIGQHSYFARQEICKNLEHLNIKLDRKKNIDNEYTIHSKSSKVKVLVIPTDEELAIAQEALKHK